MLLRWATLLGALCAGSLGCPEIVSRAQWRAARPRCQKPLRTPVDTAIIHHTAGPACSSSASCQRIVKAIQNFHQGPQRKWCDIGYNFLIGEDGRVYEGRGWKTFGAHAGPSGNGRSLGIALLGSFSSRVPNAKAQAALRSLLLCAVRRGALRGNYALKGHRNFMPTSCPGQALYDLLRRWPHFQA
ncbi:peptidoglycan recognition protein 1 [Tachyglossus aculeatus]|uniref:peptidoglycan recognition protein 1 n=1 Tax=Tachyglossus aculeatus TaxID=9261 RepID=UPI0018F65026|nr:peptidoglycan recognition protein 1 [Tachyglossus aculeatus]